MSNETAIDLDVIEARAGAATEGPWYGSGGGLAVFGATPGDEVAAFRRRDDAAFAKHARTDVPALVAEVKSLRTELDQEEREHSKTLDIMEAACDRSDAAVARAEAAEAMHRDLVSRLGFGNDITEPMADNDTIVKWVEEQARDASEWVESQQWRVECEAILGHDPMDDCFECDPSLRLETAEAKVAAGLALADNAAVIRNANGPWEIVDARDLRAVLGEDA